MSTSLQHGHHSHHRQQQQSQQQHHGEEHNHPTTASLSDTTTTTLPTSTSSAVDLSRTSAGLAASASSTSATGAHSYSLSTSSSGHSDASTSAASDPFEIAQQQSTHSGLTPGLPGSSTSTARRRYSRTRNTSVDVELDPLRLGLGGTMDGRNLDERGRDIGHSAGPSTSALSQPPHTSHHNTASQSLSHPLNVQSQSESQSYSEHTAGPSTPTLASLSPHPNPGLYAMDDDPFYSPSSHGTGKNKTLFINTSHSDNQLHAHSPSYSSLDHTPYGEAESDVDDGHGVYNGGLGAGVPSTASLIAPRVYRDGSGSGEGEEEDQPSHRHPLADVEDEDDGRLRPSSSNTLSHDWTPSRRDRRSRSSNFADPEAGPPSLSLSPTSLSFSPTSPSHSPNRNRFSSPRSSSDRSRRRSKSKSTRYPSASPSSSPLKRTGSALLEVSENLRRVSMRVVNTAGVGLGSQVRLADEDSTASHGNTGGDAGDGPGRSPVITAAGGGVDVRRETGKLPPLRGYSLGVFGPESRLRVLFYRILQYPWTEPLILVLIIINAVVLTIQASRSLTLSIPDGADDGGLSSAEVRVRGYFHTWEDWALFVLFVLFTIEAFARICTSGFLLDPEIPTSSLFSSPLTQDPDFAPPVYTTNDPPTHTQAITNANYAYPFAYPTTPVPQTTQFNQNPSTPSIQRQHSHREPQGPLARGLSMTQRIDKFRRNLRRPFALRSGSADLHASQGGGAPFDPSRIGGGGVGMGHVRSETGQSEKELSWAQKRHQRQGTTDTLGVKTSSLGVGPHYRSFSTDPLYPNAYGQLHNGHSTEPIALPFQLGLMEAHSKIQRNVPYLRHSWSRIDMIAILGFWVTFVLASTGVERGGVGGGHVGHIGLFRALSVLRTARLLAITAGTTTIMHSLKRARPLLTNVAYFVLFAIVIFSIIGIQTFQGSLRRICYIQPILNEPEIALDEQFCGGYVDPTNLTETAWLKLDGTPADAVKGYVCPLGQICRERNENPNSSVTSFDAIWFSVLQVVIIASINGWTPLMYNIIDAEFFPSSLFFIVCIIILNFWLINLFVAVITNSFSAIRSETKKSAFGADSSKVPGEKTDDGWSGPGTGRLRLNPANLAQKIYSYLKWAWVLLALVSLTLQATRTVDDDANHTDTHEDLMNWGELAITIAFDFEIVLRFLATLPHWRSFFEGGRNWLDSGLAVVCTIIQIPAIKNSAVYPWFTIFQLARFYRVILVVPRMKPLLLRVFGNVYGLFNMSLFLLLVNYIAALMAIQLLRGDIGSDVTMNFGQIFNAFLAVYQVFSSENWTDVLYNSTDAEKPLGQTIVVATFIAVWMLFANFIMMSMFVAVINENFQVAEEAKEISQVNHYWATTHHLVEEHKSGWIKQLNPYRWMKAVPIPAPPPAMEDDPMVTNVMRREGTFGTMRAGIGGTFNNTYSSSSRPSRIYSSKTLTALQRLFTGDPQMYEVPLQPMNRHKRDSTFAYSTNAEEQEVERNFELLASVSVGDRAVDLHTNAFQERLARRAVFIQQHPTYDKTFWIFSQENKIRRFCQRLVQPASPPRIYGYPPSSFLHPVIQLLLLCAVLGGIVVEIIATPQYRRRYYLQFGLIRGTWFDIGEAAFGLTLIVEFLIKVIADGFIFTPNAYLRSIWNIFDLTVLMGLIVNLTTGLIFIGGLSRFTRALKALRVLRLITLIERMRETFESLIISGALRIFDAAVLAILYMIPYAVWGLNIFAGKFGECNDGDVGGIEDCVNESVNTVIGDSFGFYAPRVWDYPSPSTTFTFDSFRSSLLILFEIVSLEGWIDVMGKATSIRGAGQQPETNVAEANALFFLVYHLIGGVVILTLFVSIIINNFSSRTGSALLTTAQREWNDLKKLFRRQKPSKRPRVRPTRPFRSWCYDRAVQKHGWWSRTMTLLFIIHIIVLMSQSYAIRGLGDTVRNYIFLGITLVYIVDAMIRFYGLGFSSYTANWWNSFDFFVSLGSFTTTFFVRFGNPGFAIEQMQKVFLVAICFKLIQRNDSLNVLFKTAVASLPTISSLLLLWLILFIFFGILYVEVFGMTKWDSAETRNQNYYSMGSALVMLTFMSTGEGWNQYMHDFALEYPRCTNNFGDLLDSDCGSIGWAFGLFIAWNILSMYIFVNLFTGVVVESFSFVFQSTKTGTVASVTREEMRSFKKVWAEFANPDTGLLERPNLVRFFGKLTGIFEIRIYPRNFDIKRLLSNCAETTPSPSALTNQNAWGQSVVVDGVDILKLRHALADLDPLLIKRRRGVYNRLYQESLMHLRDYGGISFTKMLMLIAHHKIINEREALTMKEYVDRLEINKNVKKLIYVDRVRSCLKTIHLRRRFLAIRAQRLEQEAPFIVVDTTPDTPPRTTRDISSARYSYSPRSPGPHGGSTTGSGVAAAGIDGDSYSPGVSWQFPSPPQSFSYAAPGRPQHHHQPSDVSMTGDLGSQAYLSFRDGDPMSPRPRPLPDPGGPPQS